VDTHVCPLATLQPHGTGVVAAGSTTVLINGAPAARLGDTVVESGPPNTIVGGSTTVLVE
jgi:uncharacterized Zn-binding protein involved in type VI secretion